ncbi:MAG: LLM class flavin-dependent oxidoreductase [bacterium]|nr:LLM class flavin-dependent oxidoreductase [bacterium]MDE0602609.1 LLM class flavin-dependent oxidoreductase [bacterium]
MNLPVWTVLPLFQSSPRELVGMVRESEALGLTGVVATDHLAGWRRPTSPVLEATAALGMVAAVAERRVGSLVLQAALRSPSYTADVAGTLAAICRAPPLIGLGVGDSRSRNEGDRLGISQPAFPERITLLRETIAAVRARTPGIEVWVGGWSREVREVAAELADGWNAWGGKPANFEAAVDQMKKLNPSVSISWGGLLDTACSVGTLRRTLLRRVEAGAEALVLALTPPRVATLRRWAPAIFCQRSLQNGADH